MSNADMRGKFVWHELLTNDTGAAEQFYSRVVPWKTQPSPMPSYTLWMSGSNRVGGLMSMPEGHAEGTPAHWLIYIATPDVDATVEAAKKLGGNVLKAASDIPNVGRFAVLADPQGAAFAAFSPVDMPADGPPPSGGTGDFGWHELATTDPDGAMTFYSGLFGWSKGAAHDMGAMGIYQLIAHDGKDVGGTYKARDNSTPASWLSYVNVPDAGKAAAAAKSAGGRVLHGPAEVPGGSWIVMMLDPQGGAFAVVEPPAAAKSSAQPEPAQAPKKAAAKSPASKPAVATKPAAAKPAPAKPVAAKKAAKSAPKPAASKTAARKSTKQAAKKGAKKKVAAKSLAKTTKRPMKKAAKKAARKSVGKTAKRATKKAAKTVRRAAGKAKSKSRRR